MTISILTFAPALAGPAAEPEPDVYVSPSAPVTVDSLPTPAGAVVYVYQDTDGSLSSDCTGCGEYAWTLHVTKAFAEDHARDCRRSAA
ncbi:hypothetical protein EES39_39040 [Streptomyces sp. ADI92-24]|uniref:hypothetical protein n=1 Tax=Streptomyces sp. ADI92-24 TaxID=1522756 RepID=UPI000F9A0686|nr:hypothetical protein [Streptomyces sp. ADI92-24]RPK32234.1 hypothetical protein EES39_39040 [Streptomyces sp. ADI92-24]